MKPIYFLYAISILLMVSVFVQHIQKIELKNELQELKKRYEHQKSEKENYIYKNRELLNKIKNSTIMNQFEIKELNDKGINNLEEIREDLRNRQDLINHDPVLGGTMHFSQIHLLNNGWVYAIFEDGHILGQGIFEFKFDRDNKDIIWKVLHSQLD